MQKLKLKSKLILAIVSLLLINIAYAETIPIVLTNGAPKGSPVDAEMLNTGKLLSSEGLPIDYYATGQCADTAKFWNKDDKAPKLLLYSTQFGRAERLINKPCTAKFDGAVIVQSRLNPAWLCSGKDPKPLSTPGLKVGLLHTGPGEDIGKDINTQNGWSWKMIKVNQAYKESVIQLINGEVDYHFLFQGGNITPDVLKEGNIKCFYSTMPNDSLPYIGTALHMTGDINAAMTLQQITIVKNLTKEQLNLVRNTLNPEKNVELKKYYEFKALKYISLSDNNQQSITDFWSRTYNGLLYYKK